MIIIKLSSKIKHITENQYKKIIQSLNFDELAKKQLEKIIIDFRSSAVAEMSPFANTLTDWKKEVINSFIIVDDKANRKMNTEVLEDILIRLESVSHRIDDMRLVRSKSVPRTLLERFWNISHSVFPNKK